MKIFLTDVLIRCKMYFVKIYFAMIPNICPWSVAAGFWTEGKICGISEKTRFTKKINKITENNASSFAKKNTSYDSENPGKGAKPRKQ